MGEPSFGEDGRHTLTHLAGGAGRAAPSRHRGRARSRRPRWRPPEAARHLRPHGDLRRRQVAGRRSDASPAPLTITSSLSLLPAPQARVRSQRHSCPSRGLAPQARRVLRAEARLRSRAPPPSAHLAIATSPLVLPAPQALLGSRRRPCPSTRSGAAGSTNTPRAESRLRSNRSLHARPAVAGSTVSLRRSSSQVRGCALPGSTGRRCVHSASPRLARLRLLNLTSSCTADSTRSPDRIIIPPRCRSRRGAGLPPHALQLQGPSSTSSP